MEAALAAIGLRPLGSRSNPRFFFRYCCLSRENWRFGLNFMGYLAQQLINAAQKESQDIFSAEESKRLKNKRVSVRARAKLSRAAEKLAKLLASSMAMRIRQMTIMCISSSW